VTNPKDTVGALKAPLRYVPRALDIEVAVVMATGARKYGPFNWREQPVSAITYAEAMLRHIYAWMEGQDNAEDSGLSHIAHVAASAGILLDAAANDTLLDDRTAGPAADVLRRVDQSTDAVKVEPVTYANKLQGSFPRTVYGQDRDGWDGYGGPVHLENRGEWPADTRVAGRLTCCGATEHTLTCPQWR